MVCAGGRSEPVTCVGLDLRRAAWPRGRLQALPLGPWRYARLAPAAFALAARARRRAPLPQGRRA
eukprot:13335674-Alexandrium_andersonii.AAC.1